MNSRLLIVDDDENIRLLYRSELSQSGYQVDTVGSAGDAIKCVSKNSYHAVVLDIEMPDMDGLAAMTRIREIAPELPVIINSAYSVYKADFQSWMADAYVVKSSDLSLLKKKIKEIG
jgi:DNA-binding response OmpR family regulator